MARELIPSGRPFVAIDFETADHGADSACAIGLVRVENWKIADRLSLLIRPPRDHIWFTHVHRITWDMVKDAPCFAEAWEQCQPILEGAVSFVAHNAGFDRSVLHACCIRCGVIPPALPFACTVQIAKRTWTQPRYDLASVCRRLGIPLNHHDALSDAEACARIAIAAHVPRLFDL